MSPQTTVGISLPRQDGWAKLSGEARFVDDLPAPDAWLGATVRSSIPRGRIRSLNLDPSFDRGSIVWLTAADLPGPNVISMIRDDHPILAAEEVRYVSEPVALLAAPDPETLQKAMAAVRVEYEEWTPVLTVEDALEGKAVVWGEDNVISEYKILQGDPASEMERAEMVIEGVYRTGHQEHLYLEPNGILAFPLPNGGVEVVGSLQCPYYIHGALMKALHLPAEKVIVRQAVTGGAFGGKEDFPSVLSAHAALLARRCGHPVKMVYGRSEDIRSTTKRHPSLTRIRTGVMRDGTLAAAEIDLVLDAGAYTTLSPVVLSRAILHSGGAYRIAHVSIHGRAVATNTPPNGAFRGFGAPQSLFAIERHMDRVALEMRIDPLDLRRRNLLRRGDVMPFGQVLNDEVGASLVLERAAALSGYQERRAILDPDPAPSSPPHSDPPLSDPPPVDPPAVDPPATDPPAAGRARTRRGLGLSLFFHGGGFTGSGEEKIAGRARIRFSHEDRFEILISSVDMGQGASTVLPAIVAQALGVPVENVCHPLPDTSQVPDSGPTVASRTTMIVGRILITACRDLVERLGAFLAREAQAEPNEVVFRNGEFECAGKGLGDLLTCARRHREKAGPLVGEGQYIPVPGVRWDDREYRGDAYKAYSWGADAIEVEVDLDTLQVRPIRAVAVVEIGRAINPVLVAGQVEGGTLQGIGWATMEEIKLSHGRYLNDRMATYIIPTSLDSPVFQVDIAELPYERGPFGAKGLGELPTDGAAPALAAAVTQATGLFPTSLPITPESLLALAEQGGSEGRAR